LRSMARFSSRTMPRSHVLAFRHAHHFNRILLDRLEL
jgi:hypothetical protein